MVNSLQNVCYALGDQGSTLVEIFSRSTRLDDAEIIALKADVDQQWFALVGLVPQVSISKIMKLECYYSNV